MRIAVFVRSFAGGGGAERVMLNLANGLARQGARVDLVMARRKGHFLDEIPETVQVVDLQAPPSLLGLAYLLRRAPGDARRLAPALLSGDAPRVLGSVPKLVRYLETAQPDAVISALNYTNVCALIAARLSRHRPVVAITVHNHLSAQLADGGPRRNRHLQPLLAHYYPAADRVVAVSRGVADDCIGLLGLEPRNVHAIYNPVIDDRLLALAERPVSHPWLTAKDTPVVIGIGKLKPQKDFETLIRAFASLRARRPARLLILGEGPGRAGLEALAADLGIGADVDLPGFVSNPMAMLQRADVFALSSRFEGFGNVLVEALACGIPVVSTDCPSGPAEILEAGRYGTLVAVGDPAGLADGLHYALDTAPQPDVLRARAAEFSVDRAARAYLELLGGTDGSTTSALSGVERTSASTT